MTDARKVMVAALKGFTRLDQTKPEMMVAEQMLALTAAGLVVVPRKPTQKMWEAYDKAWKDVGLGRTQSLREWRAMVEAASDE
jgi:hypothetical protein